MKDRIAQIMQKEAMTAAQFAEKIGISPASLSHILSGRNNPSLDVAMKIRKAFAYVNWEWLLDGKGELGAPIPKEETGESFPSGGLYPDENPFFSNGRTDECENRKETEPKTPSYAPKEIVREQVKIIETPARKITEIRIFFDNGTYETFRPEK